MNLRLLALAVSLSLASASRAEACRCKRPGTTAESFASARWVFRGKVVAVGEGTSSVTPVAVTFTVSRSWKGKIGRQIVVYTGSGDGDCGFSFAVGEEYLVWGYNQRYESGEGKQRAAHFVPATDDCTKTAKIADAQAELAWLSTASK